MLRGAAPGLLLNESKLDLSLRAEQMSNDGDLRPDVARARAKAKRDTLTRPLRPMWRGGGYAALKSRVWDNVFALTVLGESTALRTEEVRIIRLLNVVEKIASNDALLDTGTGIFSAYLSTVLLPNDVFHARCCPPSRSRSPRRPIRSPALRPNSPQRKPRMRRSLNSMTGNATDTANCGIRAEKRT
ncbi:MAG: hypothetical protein IPF41_15555 [Flavobacteriales bacterium]|nr:hypothetical protein [Flavobacteriales bacterium]